MSQIQKKTHHGVTQGVTQRIIHFLNQSCVSNISVKVLTYVLGL